jgi:hypothetical protein
MDSEQTTYRTVPSRPVQLPRALAVFNALNPDEQGRILEQYERLTRAPVGQGAWKAFQPFGKAPGLKLLRVGDDLNVIFRLIEGRQPEVVDIVWA